MKISIKVRPGARENSVVENGNELTVLTTAHAHGGKANGVVCRLVAEHFGVSSRRVTIIQGTTSRRKILEIE